MNKSVTRAFHRNTIGEKLTVGWENRLLGSLCHYHVSRLWHIPENVTKIWITASTEPNPDGHSYRLSSMWSNWRQIRTYGWDIGLPFVVSQFLAKRFDKPRLYITVEYVE